MTNPQAAANTPRTAADRYEQLRKDYNVAIANGLVLKARRIDRQMRAIEAEAAAPTPAERREALRELSRDADDLGIYVEPLTSGSCGCKPYSPCDRHQAESDARLIPAPEGLNVGVLADVLPAALNFEAFAFPVGHPKWREIAERITRLMRERQP